MTPSPGRDNLSATRTYLYSVGQGIKNFMSPRSLVRLALAGAALALAPAAFAQSGQLPYAPIPQARPQAAISGNFDKETTGAMRAQPDALTDQPPVGAAHVSALKSGLDALAAKDLGRARAVRDGLPAAALDRHILTWAIALQGGGALPSGEIAA